MTDRERALARLRMLAGFAIAPVVAAAIALVAYQAFFNLGLFPSGASLDSMDHAASLGMGTLILAVLMTFAAVPAVLVLREHRPLSLRRLLLLGAAVGNVPLTLIVAGILLTQVAGGRSVIEASRLWEGLSGLLVRVAMGLVCGMGSAAAFWTVALAGVERDSDNP
jgi:hypothetical protein